MKKAELNSAFSLIDQPLSLLDFRFLGGGVAVTVVIGAACRWLVAISLRRGHLVACGLAHLLNVSGAFVGIGVRGEQLFQSALLTGLATQLNQHVERVIHGVWINAVLDTELESGLVSLGLLTA